MLGLTSRWTILSLRPWLSRQVWAYSRAAQMFAKLCGVDLRPGKFADGAIAQTSLARMNAVVIRDDRGGALAYHLLGDSASAAYLWDCLTDAMAEFDGRPVGLAAARALADAGAG